MVRLFDFKSDKHFVASSDKTTLRVCELRNPTMHPSSIRKTHWREVADIAVDHSDEDIAEEHHYGGLLFFDGHGKIEGQKALTELAQHLSRLRLMVSPGGFCFQDVTELGEHKEFGVHYLRLNDLFYWPRHGVDSTWITMWQRLELKYTLPGHEKIPKKQTAGGVSKEKYEELKRMLKEKDEELEKVTNETEDEMQKLREEKDEELQTLRETMEEAIERKDEELRKVRNQKNKEKQPTLTTGGLSKEKYDELRRVVREKDEELEKLKERMEEELEKTRVEKDGEILKLKEEMDDASEKHEDGLRRLRKEKDDELRKLLKKKDGALNDDGAMLQKLRKEQAKELRKLREETEEEIEKVRKEKDEEVGNLEKREEEALQKLRGKNEELEKVRAEKARVVETGKLREQLLEHNEQEQCRKQLWTRLPTTRILDVDKHLIISRRRPVPRNIWDSNTHLDTIYLYPKYVVSEASMFPIFVAFKIVDEETKDWPPPSKMMLPTIDTSRPILFDQSNWWFVKTTHPGGGLTMLAYYDGNQCCFSDAFGRHTQLPFPKDTALVSKTAFFLLFVDGTYKLAFMYRE